MANPYVGPRAFLPGETLYGRDDEVRELFYLLAAERIVLLHSPSGAGKTSLIQAALIPRLAAEGFSVLPIIRVGAEPPPGAAGNRFLLSTLLALDEALPEEQQLAPAALAGLSLHDYLLRRPGHADPTGSEVLIFDQFEEVLTLDPAGRAAREEFFAQLGAALRDRRRWALFAMREEYVAALEPYLRPIPTRLANTFRLELLGPEAAIRAMRDPARARGVEFRPEAAARLADDLRRAVIQRPDGSSEIVLGQAIEPVQLQVVCRRLWERLPPDATLIDEELVAGEATAPQPGEASVSPVDRALMDYYAERARAVAAEAGVGERAVRDWCEGQLITADGLRGQVLQQPGSSAGLANAAIDGLRDAHLVRAEQRRGATWYELAHDRLVAPIRADNASWRAANLSLLQLQAATWERQGRPADLLLSGEALLAEERALPADLGELNPVERAYLAACRAARAEAERRQAELEAEQARRRAELEAERARAERERELAARDRRRLRLIGALAIVLLLVGLLAGGLAVYASQQADQARAAEGTAVAEAQRAQSAEGTAEAEARRAESEASAARTAEAEAAAQARISRAGELGVRAGQAAGESPQLALLLAAAAARPSLDAGEPLPPAAAQALIDLLSATGGDPVSNPRGFSKAFALSPDARELAVGTFDGEIWLYDVGAADLTLSAPEPLQAAGSGVNALAFSPDGRALAATTFEGGLHIFNHVDLAAPPLMISSLAPESSNFTVGYSPDSRWIIAQTESELLLIDPDRPRDEPLRLAGSLRLLSLAVVSPDGRWLVAGDGAGGGLRWDLAADSPGETETAIQPDGEPLYALAISPDSRWLLAGAGREIYRWELAVLEPDTPGDLIGAHDEPVNDLAVSPDGRSLASASNDTTLRLWPLDDPAAAPLVLRGHGAPIRSVAFSPDGRTLASGGEELNIRLWDATSGAPLPTAPLLRGHEDAVIQVAFIDNDLLLSQDFSRYIRLWNLAWPAALPAAGFDTRDCAACAGEVSTMAIDPAERRLAVGTDAGALLYDLAADDPSASAQRLPGEAPVNGLTFAGRWLLQSISLPSTLDSNLQLLDLRADPPALAAEFAALQVSGLSLDRRWLAVLRADGTLELHDLEATDPGVPVAQADIGLADAFTRELAVAPGGRWVALTGEQGVLLWDSSAPTVPLRVGRRPESGSFDVQSVDFSPDGRWLAYGEFAGSVSVWDMQALDTPPRQITLHPGANIFSVAFSPDGRRLASASADGEIRVRAVGADGPEEDAHVWRDSAEFSIAELEFSADSTRLISGGIDGAARIYDMERGGLSLRLPVGSPVYGVALTSDGRAITASRDGFVRVWELEPARLHALACAAAGRGLTEAERAAYFPAEPADYDPCAP